LQFAEENLPGTAITVNILMSLGFSSVSNISQLASSGSSFVAEMSQEDQKRPRPL
jgi:hypothetical protein